MTVCIFWIVKRVGNEQTNEQIKLKVECGVIENSKTPIGNGQANDN